MLGLGRTITETQTPMEITLPENVPLEKIISVSAGSLHVTICTNTGNVYSWGSRSHAGFDVQTSSSSTLQQQNRKPPTIMKGPTSIEELMQFEWSPRRVEFSNSTIHGRSKSYHNTEVRHPKLPQIVQVRAGNDCTFFVTECGKVLSSGKSSGRLGQGEYDSDVTIPKPLFGGLHLFQPQENDDSLNSNEIDALRSTTTSLRSKARRLASV
jgi:alpha-tubulin suppressor-like RCC1 family protein